jgi:hypothetical protein
MKVNWTVVALIVGVLAPVLAWAIHVEVVLNDATKIGALSERVAQLETALLPLLIEYRVAETLKTRLSPPPVPVRGGGTKAMTIEFDESKARTSAEEWARGQLPNVSQMPEK